MLQTLDGQEQEVLIAPVVPLWRDEEVMEYLHCKKVTLWRYIRECGLPAIKIKRTGRRLYRPERVQEWLAQYEPSTK